MLILRSKYDPSSALEFEDVTQIIVGYDAANNPNGDASSIVIWVGDDPEPIRIPSNVYGATVVRNLIAAAIGQTSSGLNMILLGLASTGDASNILVWVDNDPEPVKLDPSLYGANVVRNFLSAAKTYCANKLGIGEP